MRWTKRRWLRKQAEKLVDKIDPKNGHKMIQQMESKLLGKREQIGRIIKPQISIQPLDAQQRLKLKYQDYTMNDNETAMEIASYMTTIGTKDNPGYRKGLSSSRQLSRELDEEFDFKKRDVDPNVHQRAMQQLTSKWTLDEIHHALYSCKNNG